ncbi:MAG: DUF2238 domain-containing protein [Bacillota bacterium]
MGFMESKKFHLLLLASFIGLLIWSLINPEDIITWFFEVMPIILIIILLIYYYSCFQFTDLAYLLIWIDAVIILVGGHYTYSKVPLFTWLKDIFHLSRNHYDRFGHFFQGFSPAIVFREVFIRKSILPKGKLLFFIIIAICLSISTAYELIEFAAAKLLGSNAKAFLGTQGDQWDSHWDMLFALVGTLSALLLLKDYHDQLLEKKKGQLNVKSPYLKHK